MALTKEQNEALTRVGSDTPMGKLLRNYWHPIASATDLDVKATKKVKILGEELVLYRDLSGKLGLIDWQCPHRNVSMEYGIPEEDGLRCPYHGWKFDSQGNCTEQPAEPDESTFKDRICIKSYPVEQFAGLIFAYMGEGPAPLIPKYDLFLEENALRTIGTAVIPCNWLQIMENSLDPVHLEWLHGQYMQHVLRREGQLQDMPYAKLNSGKHKKIKFDRVEHGIVKRRLIEGQSEDGDDWSTGHPVIFPNILRVGRGVHHSFQYRVPMDDENTLYIWYNCYIPTNDDIKLPEDYPITTYQVPFQKENGDYIDDFVAGQDIMCWITQGAIADRRTEHLGTSDKGIILYRQLLTEQMEKVKSGEEPMNVFRDPAKNERIKFEQEADKGGGGDHSVHRIGILRQHSRFAPNIIEILDMVEGVKK